ncbi:Uncharacterised protein [Escherichia coli]|nr:Uncharacterised protein [Escherichia coli]
MNCFSLSVSGVSVMALFSILLRVSCTIRISDFDSEMVTLFREGDRHLFWLSQTYTLALPPLIIALSRLRSDASEDRTRISPSLPKITEPLILMANWRSSALLLSVLLLSASHIRLISFRTWSFSAPVALSVTLPYFPPEVQPWREDTQSENTLFWPATDWQTFC